MYKGMKSGFLCALLVLALVAPSAQAQGMPEGFSPFDVISEFFNGVAESLQEGLSEVFEIAFLRSEEDDEEEEELPEGPTSFTSDPPPIPPGAENGDGDDGNTGPGGDPFGG